MPKCFLKTVGDFRLRCQHTYRHITDIGINLFEYINDVIEKTIDANSSFASSEVKGVKGVIAPYGR